MNKLTPPPIQSWKVLLEQAFIEDMGVALKDASADLLPENTRCQATMTTREPMVMCGQDWVEQAFLTLDEDCTFNWSVTEGQVCPEYQQICTINGHEKALLAAERIALNGLQLLTATATQTHQLVAKIAHTSTQLLDTRKTIPGWRAWQKYAVLCGGGSNHRMGLYDAILLKENHLIAGGGIDTIMQQLRAQQQSLKLMIEVENLAELEWALRYNIEHILLDNFSFESIEQAVLRNAGQAKLEVSGNITEANIAQYAELGVDYISVGALTKNVRAIDLSMRFERSWFVD